MRGASGHLVNATVAGTVAEGPLDPNKLAITCQCCAQGKDAARSEDKRRCCAIWKCCHETLSARSRKDARDTLRAALTCAVEDETIARNPVTAVKMTQRREPRQRRKRQAWTVDDARWFLESAWHAREALYAAFVLVLVLGLRRGEVLGLAWDQVDLDDAELYVAEQLQRVRGDLVRREVKTERHPRHRCRCPTCASPHSRSVRSSRITVHGTRKTCASLLAALDVHPRVAMRILRHSKIAVTMEIYTEAPSDATRDALRKLGDWLA
jgi:integrase